MKRAIKLDPNMVTTPGRKHAYITKSKLEEIKEVIIYHSTSKFCLTSNFLFTI